MRNSRFVLAVLGLCCAPTIVDASVVFSFAANDNPDGPTFLGEGMIGQPHNMLFDGHQHDASGAVVVNLQVDVNGSDPGGVTVFQSTFSFTGQTNSYGATPFGGGFIHNYSMSGFFTFTAVGSGLEVLRINFNNALLSSFSDDQFALGRTATIQSNGGVDPGLMFIPGLPLQALGVGAGSLAMNKTMSFAIADMHDPETPSLPLHLGASGEWAHHWVGDAGFTASAAPTPGAAFPMMLGLMLWTRRRRR